MYRVLDNFFETDRSLFRGTWYTHNQARTMLTSTSISKNQIIIEVLEQLRNRIGGHLGIMAGNNENWTNWKGSEFVSQRHWLSIKNYFILGVVNNHIFNNNDLMYNFFNLGLLIYSISMIFKPTNDLFQPILRQNNQNHTVF
jgi:hypothetical protein